MSEQRLRDAMRRYVGASGCPPHEFSAFGHWCWKCGLRFRWWAFWQSWTPEEPTS